jgi:hypothetical protein
MGRMACLDAEANDRHGRHGHDRSFDRLKQSLLRLDTFNRRALAIYSFACLMNLAVERVDLLSLEDHEFGELG